MRVHVGYGLHYNCDEAYCEVTHASRDLRFTREPRASGIDTAPRIETASPIGTGGPPAPARRASQRVREHSADGDGGCGKAFRIWMTGGGRSRQADAVPGPSPRARLALGWRGACSAGLPARSRWTRRTSTTARRWSANWRRIPCTPSAAGTTSTTTTATTGTAISPAATAGPARPGVHPAP